jgi:CubicO group peptidase (beta-lactamase class C family)
VCRCNIATAANAQTATRESVLAAVPKLEAIAEQRVANGGVPALSIGIVYNDEVVYLGGFGVREEGKPNNVDADSCSSSPPYRSRSPRLWSRRL